MIYEKHQIENLIDGKVEKDAEEAKWAILLNLA